MSLLERKQILIFHKMFNYSLDEHRSTKQKMIFSEKIYLLHEQQTWYEES